jgi:HEAT repeat protein
MENAADQVRHYLDLLRQGNRDDAFFGLVDPNPAVLDELIAAFKKETDVEVRAFLVEVVWQHRRPSTIPFLAAALHDPEPAVWREALDGLATLAVPEALEALRAARRRPFTVQKEANEFRDELEDAIEEAEEAAEEP